MYHLSFLYMFTGIEESPYEIIEKKDKEIAELKARLAKYENV